MSTLGKRLVVVGGKRVEIEDVEIPDPGPGQVLVRITRSLVSAGSEKSLLLQKTHPDTKSNLGYTTVGRVQKSGTGMESFKPGDRVFTFGHHGTHWLSEPDSNANDPINIQRIEHNITDEQAALTRLGDVALHCIRRGELQIDEQVAVFGQGVVGQFVTAFARLSGAYPVIGIDLDDHRLELARQSGATHTINPSRENTVDAVRDITNGGAQTVFHANREPGVLGDCMKSCAMRGKVVLVGSAPGVAEIGLQVELLRLELDIRGSYGTIHDPHRYYPWTQRRDRKAIMRMIESSDLKVDHLISHVSRPEDANSLYQTIVAGPHGWMGIFFNWEKFS